MATGLAPTDPDIATRAAQIIGTDSPLMRQASATGMASANRRGLINSSMGIGAAQNAVLGVAVPIASQESSQAATAKNLQTQLASTEGIAARDLTSRETLTREQIKSTEGLSANDIASREKLSQAQIASNEGMAQRDINSRESINSSQIAAQERERQLSAQVQASGNYQQAIVNLLNNKDIPANERASTLAALRADYANTMSTMQKLYGVTPPASTPATNTAAGYAPASGGYSGSDWRRLA